MDKRTRKLKGIPPPLVWIDECGNSPEALELLRWWASRLDEKENSLKPNRLGSDLQNR